MPTALRELPARPCNQAARQLARCGASELSAGRRATDQTASRTSWEWPEHREDNPCAEEARGVEETIWSRRSRPNRRERQAAGTELAAGKAGSNEYPGRRCLSQPQRSPQGRGPAGVMLGEEAAATVYRHLSQTQLQRLTQEIRELRGVQPETATNVLEEYHRLSLTQDYLAQGGEELCPLACW